MKEHISVCICTYKRPQYLKRLLEKLGEQRTEEAFTFSVVVTDNDREESARPVVEAFAAASGRQVSYCVEPNQNIPMARNRALREARGEYVAFIDDDEFPIPDWLLILYRTCKEKDVDGVLGPVKPHFDEAPPQWVIKGKFYDRPSYPTGFVIDWRKGRTGNVLFKRAILEGIDEPFRPEFLTGEDQDFFRRMIERGHVFIWCHEAVAYEVVPPIRWNRRFMLRRALLRGKVSLRHRGTRGVGLTKSLVAVPLYSLSLPFTFLFGFHVFMTYLIRLCDHAGRILAWVGLDLVKESYVTE